MIRSALIAAVAFTVFAPARAGAQPPFDPTPAGFRVVDAKADKDKLTWSEVAYIPQVKEVERIVNINGMNVTRKVAFTVMVPVVQTVGYELKKLKATDGAGKGIDADKLAGLLKETTSVVIVPGSVPEKHRKLFRDTTVFIELPPPETSKKEPVPVPVPPMVVDPSGKPPVVPPPGEKKSGR